jgi:hypothetical protein
MRPSQILNVRQRKSFRSRLKDSSRKSYNDIFNQNSKNKHIKLNTKQPNNGESAALLNQDTNKEHSNDNNKKKRPNIILMMSDDQVIFIKMYSNVRFLKNQHFRKIF